MRSNTRRITLRNAWLQIHLWLGLTLGVVGALLGISGSILVFDDEIDAVMHPQRYAISGDRVSLPSSEYAKRAQQAIDAAARPVAIRMPDRESGPIVVLARAGTGPFQRAYLDPPTGQVLETASGRDFLMWLHGFHESLTLREYNGREIVGVVGIAMLISSLSGVYLWWPARRSLRKAMSFRHGGAVPRDLHHTFGFWGSVLLAVLSFTGIFLGFPDAGRAVVGWFGMVSPPARAVQSAEASGRVIGPDVAVEKALTLHPGASVIAVGFPTGPRGAYRINLREPEDTNARTATVVFIDSHSSDVIYRSERATRGGGDAFLLWQRMLHEGSAFGTIGRIVTALAGLLPPLLMVTGLLIWLRRRAVGCRERNVTAVASSAD